MENLILKTGFDNSINNSSQSEEYELQMMSLMAVFMENAVKTQKFIQNILIEKQLHQ